jgi:hypothetical protein
MTNTPLFIKEEQVRRLNHNLSHFGLAQRHSTGNFLIDTLLPNYEDVLLNIANQEFYLASMNNMCDVLIHMGEFPTTGYISELLIALGFVNIRYTESDKLAKVLGVPTAATGLVYEKYDKQLRKLNIYPDKVYQFLLGIHTCGMSPRTTTMAGKEDVRYPALIRDVWMLTILDPLTFCKYWTEDYIHSTVDNPTPENLSKAQSEYDKAVKKNLIAKNTASRRKAHLHAFAKSHDMKLA